MSNTFHAIHNDWDTKLTLPFVVVGGSHDDLYIDSMWGLKIDSVVADNIPIAPEPYEALLDDINFGRIPIGTDHFVYVVRCKNFTFAKSIQEDGDFNLERHTLPMNARQLVIKYRMRESGNSFGSQMTLISHLV